MPLCYNKRSDIEKENQVLLQLGQTFKLKQVISILVAGYDMMIEGGPAEGGDVQAKDMRTEINGGQDGNIEVSSSTSNSTPA